MNPSSRSRSPRTGTSWRRFDACTADLEELRSSPGADVLHYSIQHSPQRSNLQDEIRERRIELDVDGGKKEFYRKNIYTLMSRLSSTVRSFTSQRTLCTLQANLAKVTDQNGGEILHSPMPGPSKRCVSTMSPQDTDKDFEAVIKIVQRFRKEPQNWPVEEQPFGIIERTFVGKTMHPVELRPERGFVNMVPIGFMMFRHFFRKVRAKGNFELFKSTGIFDEEEVRQGAKRVFEIISQHATKDNMDDLVKNNVCGQELIDRFEGASSKMSPKQRELLNLTEKDVYAIAPGVLGPFQLIRPLSRGGSPFITYSLLCCAFYKKQMLFNAVRNLPLMEQGEKVEFVPIPPDYGYAAPRLIFGFTTFGNRIIGRGKVEQDVQLLDFQYLVI